MGALVTLARAISAELEQAVRKLRHQVEKSFGVSSW